MPVEVEAKMKVADLGVIRERLRASGAARVGQRFELNAFFDTPDRALKSRDEGLRVRSMTDEAGATTAVMTFKGPHVGKSGDALKRREEIEFAVGDLDAAAALLARLGFGRTLAFEKRRETWTLHDCFVELDALPHLGTFVEIEGAADAIAVVRTTLALDGEPLITRGYIGMMTKLVAERPELGPIVRFESRAV